MKKIYLILALFIFSSACVSVNLAPKHVPAEKYEFKAPPEPFEELESDQIKKAWQNKTNGNSISIFSNCDDTSDPSLDYLQKELLSVLEDQVVEKKEKATFNQRASLTTTTQGKMDGVQVKMKTMTFKKNYCSFSLNYVGTIKRFDEDLQTFNKFINEFRVP